MEKFPSDVRTAELRTGGDPNIVVNDNGISQIKSNDVKTFAISNKRQPNKPQRGRGRGK